MKLLQLENSSAQRIYDDYIVRCKKSLKILSEEDREDSLLEINSYIYEYLTANKENDKDAVENLLNILDRIGIPEETFKELIASKKISQAVKTFNPKVLMQALFLNIQNGFIYIILSILFLFLAAFPVLIVLKLIKPNDIGLFVGNHSFFFGFADSKNGTELLGNGFIPVSIIATAVIYFLILFILKTKRQINNTELLK